MHNSRTLLIVSMFLAAMSPALAVDTDGDGVEDDVDNCPFVINPNQEDEDGGGVGDACAVCPNGDDDSDWGGDGISCYQDNCWTLFNPNQYDADQDGVGNECDDCLMDPGNDPDGDDLCDGSGDVCPTGYNLPLSNVIRVSQDLFGANDVVAWAASPDGPEIAFVANIKQYADDPLLYLSSTGGGPPQLLSSVPDVSKVCFTPDGQHVVFQTDPQPSIYGIWSVPVSGGPPTLLREGWPFHDFFVTPGGERVLSLKTHGGSNPRYSMESVRVDGSDPQPLESEVFLPDRVRVTPDGSQVVYILKEGSFLPTELWSIPAAGGTPTLLVGGPGDTSTFDLSPDGATVAFARSIGNGFYELSLVPVTGGAIVTLYSGVYLVTPDSITYTPDGSRILFLAGDAGSSWDSSLYSLSTGGGTPVTLNLPLPDGGSVDEYQLSPDGAVVVYLADQNVVGKRELYAVPVAGGIATQLNVLLASDEDVMTAVISPDGTRVAYEVAGAGHQRIYTVPLGGGLSTLVIDQDLGFTSTLLYTPDGGTLIFPCDVEDEDTVAVCSHRHGQPVELLAPHADEQDELGLASDANTILFRANYAEQLTMELWAVHLTRDEDGDGVWDPCEACPFDTGPDTDGDGCGDSDNCPTLPNADQSDLDEDGLGDACDLCPTVAGPVPDTDGDFAGEPCDNCPGLPNPTQRDYDQDGYGDACDCAVGAPGVFGLPSEIANLRFLADGETLAWDSGAPGAGPDIAYDVIRGAVGYGPVGEPGVTCIASGIPDEFLYEPAVPPIPGYYYVVRGGNYCGTGPWGAESSGTPRETTACP